MKHYYPFGLEIPALDLAAAGTDENKYLYNGKEIEDDVFDDDKVLMWYHYGARYYDPQLGRWHSVDPVDEFYSLYIYVGNNPIMLIDPDGMQTRDKTPPDSKESESPIGAKVDMMFAKIGAFFSGLYNLLTPEEETTSVEAIVYEKTKKVRVHYKLGIRRDKYGTNFFTDNRIVGGVQLTPRIGNLNWDLNFDSNGDINTNIRPFGFLLFKYSHNVNTGFKEIQYGNIFIKSNGGFGWRHQYTTPHIPLPTGNTYRLRIEEKKEWNIHNGANAFNEHIYNTWTSNYMGNQY